MILLQKIGWVNQAIPSNCVYKMGHSIPYPFCNVTIPLTSQGIDSIYPPIEFALPCDQFHQKNVGRSETVKLPRLRSQETFSFCLCTWECTWNQPPCSEKSKLHGESTWRTTKVFQSPASVDLLADIPAATFKLSQTFQLSQAYR